jgi:hypothetical protein
MALIRYQVAPDLGEGQVAVHLDPVTLATTVTFAAAASWALTADPVDVPVRTFTPGQAGTIVIDAAAVGGGTTSASASIAATATGSHARSGAWRVREGRGGEAREIITPPVSSSRPATRYGSMGPPEPVGAMGPSGRGKDLVRTASSPTYVRVLPSSRVGRTS